MQIPAKTSINLMNSNLNWNELALQSSAKKYPMLKEKFGFYLGKCMEKHDVVLGKHLADKF